MKQKIKIMKEPELSDDEIRGYMNFDRLLENAKGGASPAGFPNLLKRIIPVVAISGMLVWFIFFATPEKEPIVTTNAKKISGTSAQIQDLAKVAPTSTDEPGVDVRMPEPSPAISLSADKNIAKNPAPPEAAQAKEVYVQAEPVDGYSFLYDYFNANLSYPPEAIKDSVEGVQTVSFLISAEGKPEKILVKESLGSPFEREASRLIENMPPWKPATLNGKPVASQVSLPLTFKLRKAKTNE